MDGCDDEAIAQAIDLSWANSDMCRIGDLKTISRIVFRHPVRGCLQTFRTPSAGPRNGPQSRLQALGKARLPSAARPGHFLFGPKRKWPKKRAFPDTSNRRSVAIREFSDSPILGSVGKRRASLRVALRVCNPCRRACRREEQRPDVRYFP